MAKTERSGPIRFTYEALATIAAALPLEAPPERIALLPELLRAWAEEDLLEHLSQEGRAAHRHRSARLAALRKTATRLRDAVHSLDETGRFPIASEPQMRREFAIGNPPWRRTGLWWWPDDIEGAERRRDEALSWLYDLIEALGEPEQRPPPDKHTRSYLVVLDLLAMYELVTCTDATRRIDPESSQPYGPFWDLLTAVCRSLPQVRSLDRATRDVLTHSPREFSPFIPNLQFRHPTLWQKLR
jgi:hypothetical protein